MKTKKICRLSIRFRVDTLWKRSAEFVRSHRLVLRESLLSYIRRLRSSHGRPADYNGGHEGAALAQDRLDRLVIAWAPRSTGSNTACKTPVLLRSRKPLPPARPVVGESSDFLLAGDRTAAVPDSLHIDLAEHSARARTFWRTEYMFDPNLPLLRRTADARNN